MIFYFGDEIVEYHVEYSEERDKFKMIPPVSGVLKSIVKGNNKVQRQ